ncbi:uroporphyrinogen-III C-methyltransferase [Anditalea andensis]|uniref:uroporphyrinogen-III C-methyltransferase n=1 Tax=Anditalea andensis TaxID=1048983 RepID=A0A074KXH0_9BACT|nr:uroporphyrinogen-III C-methyltransferase [Anditalea andensis]KEO72318.1 uroporphyrin-III methyltransferase [Anditalea andensis]
MRNSQPRLSLVGAGPGDPDLITLKAIKTLQSADVILYDALANIALLDHAPSSTLKIYVGKRAGLHSQQQQEINKMIVGYAQNMGHVVRLKGGDPYVFGRGHEELEYARSQGIPVSYVPGVSSAIAVAGIEGIPLTKRGVNESFWVITGTLKDGSLAKDLHLAAQSSATIVILMGLKKIKEIVALFQKARGINEPMAIIQNGSLDCSTCLISTLGGIMDENELGRLSAPAIIVIGKVVNEKKETIYASLKENISL